MLTPNSYNLMSRDMLISLIEQMHNENTRLTQLIEKTDQELRDTLRREEILKEQAIVLQEAIDSLNLTIYGRRTERTKAITDPLPDNTFNEAEAIADPTVEEPSVEEIVKPLNRGKKKEGKREEDFEGLEVRQVICDITEEEHICPGCGSNVRKVGTVIRREIVTVPAQVYVREYITSNYTCDECEKKGEKSIFIEGKTPRSVLPGSGIASPEAIAQIAFKKFYMGLPLYRQEKELRMMGFTLRRQTMANWMIIAAQRYFKPLFDIMHEDLLKSDVIHSDDTFVTVLKEPERPGHRPKNSKSYFWSFRTGRFEPHQIILFKYSYSRSHCVPEEFLKGFMSYAHIDGYEAYHCIEWIIWVGCMAHLRRKFTDALKLIPEKDRGKIPLTLCEIGLEYINRLFEIEDEIKELTPEQILETRNEKSRPIVDEFFEWVKENNPLVTPKSKIGKAFIYAINQEEYLRRYLLDGRLSISNNRMEQNIRGIAIGKNYVLNNTMCSWERKSS